MGSEFIRFLVRASNRNLRASMPAAKLVYANFKFVEPQFVVLINFLFFLPAKTYLESGDVQSGRARGGERLDCRVLIRSPFEALCY